MIKNYIGIGIVSLFVLVALIYGFTSSGSPMMIRNAKFDSQRLSDINTIKYSIESFFQTNKRLPATLTETQSSATAYSSQTPTDPENKKSYEYIPENGGISYKLCAVFSLSNEDNPSKQNNNYNYYGMNYRHPKGRFCFDNMAPKLYPVYNNYVQPTSYPPPSPSNSDSVARKFSQINNKKRSSDVSAILNAIMQYNIHNNVFPAGITSTNTVIAAGGLDLCPLLVPTYLAALPIDPQVTNESPVTTCNSTYNTYYFVSKDSLDRVTVSAPNAELGEVISVIR